MSKVIKIYIQLLKKDLMNCYRHIAEFIRTNIKPLALDTLFVMLMLLPLSISSIIANIYNNPTTVYIGITINFPYLWLVWRFLDALDKAKKDP